MNIETAQGLSAALRAGLGMGGREANAAALRRVGDWSAVAKLARRHRVGALALRGLRKAGVGHSRAEAEFEALRKMSALRGMSQLAGLVKALECLDKHDIPSLVLKGLPLGVRLFGNPFERECYDIDLLVPPDAAAAAASALCRAGWKMRAPSFEPTPARIRCYDRYVKDRILAGPGGVLELHHRLTHNPFLLPARFEDLRSAGAAAELGGASFAVLGDIDLLTYLCVHGQMHRWSRLKWLCDFAALAASLDEDLFTRAIERGRRHGLALESQFGTALLLCREVLHTGLPACAARLASGARAARAARKTRAIWGSRRDGVGIRGAARRLDEMRTALAVNPSPRGAAHELKRLFAAPYDLGRVNLPDRLFFLYFPLRPLLWLSGWLDRKRKRAASGGLSNERRAA